MMHAKSLSQRLLVGLTLMLAGCQLFSSDPTDHPVVFTSYDWGFVNVSDQELAGVYLFMARHGEEVKIGMAGALGGTDPTFGAHVASSKTGISPQRIPDEVIMRWKTPDGADHRQLIPLTGIVPNMTDFHGTLWFRYDGTNWKPMPLSEKQMEQRSIAGKNAAPVEVR